MHSADRPICEIASSIDLIGRTTRSIYGLVDCTDCLRRVIAEHEERGRVLRDLLDKVETLS